MLSDVTGINIHWTEKPVQHWLPIQTFDGNESKRIVREVNKLLKKRVIEKVRYTPNMYYQALF